MDRPRAALFDLDDTLAESFQPPKPEMLGRLERLLAFMPIAIVSGADFDRIKAQIIAPLSNSPRAAKLFAFPDSASQGYMLKEGRWDIAYSEDFTPEEEVRIVQVLKDGVTAAHILDAKMKYEPKILIGPTQIRYAALGLDASQEDKTNWDPDKSKRRRLKELLDPQLPECEVLLGGATTIDITKRGVDKSHGVMWLSKHLNIPVQEMLYVGDALYEGGNDHVVIKTGIQTRAVSGPPETARVLDELLAACASV